jgi:hypothetical protein
MGWEQYIILHVLQQCIGFEKKAFFFLNVILQKLFSIISMNRSAYCPCLPNCYSQVLPFRQSSFRFVKLSKVINWFNTLLAIFVIVPKMFLRTFGSISSPFEVCHLKTIWVCVQNRFSTSTRFLLFAASKRFWWCLIIYLYKWPVSL